MKRVLPILIFILLFSSLALAEDPIKIQSNRISENVEPGGIIKYEIFLNNTGTRTQPLTLSLEPTSSNIIDNIQFDPSLSPIEVKAKQTTKIIVSLRLSDDINPNTNYIINLIIQDIIGDIRQEFPLTIRANPYDNLINIRYITPHIIPTQTNEFIIELTNKGNDFLEAVEVRFESDIFTSSKVLDLIPRRPVNIEFNINIDSSTKYGNYDSKVVIFDEQQVIGRSNQIIRVVKQSDLKETERFDKGIFSITTIITETNAGNTNLDIRYEKEFNWFQNIFVFTDPKPTEKTKIDGTYTYIWTQILEPGKSMDIKTKVDYKPLIGIIILLLVAIFGIKAWYETGVLIRKKLMKTKEGIKVVLSVKNNLQTAVNNVQVIDRLPSALQPDDYEIANPDKVMKTNHGTNIRWDVSHLAKGEERIFSYKIKHKIHIIGKILLPSATVVYRHKGSEFRIRSNKLGLYR